MVLFWCVVVIIQILGLACRFCGGLGCLNFGLVWVGLLCSEVGDFLFPRFLVNLV